MEESFTSVQYGTVVVIFAVVVAYTQVKYKYKANGPNRESWDKILSWEGPYPTKDITKKGGEKLTIKKSYFYDEEAEQ